MSKNRDRNIAIPNIYINEINREKLNNSQSAKNFDYKKVFTFNFNFLFFFY